MNRAAAAPFAMLGFAILCFASSYRATAIGAGHATSLMLSALRVAPAAPALLLALPLLHARLPRGRTALWAVGTGVLMVALFNFGVTEGTARAGAGNTSVLINTLPFFVLLMGFFFLHERVSRIAVAGVLVGFAGVVLMVSSQLGGGRDAGSFAIGVAVSLVASVGYAVGMLIVKAIAERDPELDIVGFTAVQMSAGSALLLAIAFGADGTRGTDWGSGDFWADVAYLSLLTTALGQVAFYGALRRLSAGRVSASAFLIPAVAVVIEIGYGNTPTAVVLTGMVLTILGVALVNTPREQLVRLLRLLRLAPAARQA